MTALEYLEQSVQKDIEKETLYNKAIINEELINFKPSSWLRGNVRRNRNITLEYNEMEIPKLNIIRRPGSFSRDWELEAEFKDGYTYQEMLIPDSEFSLSLTLSYFKGWANKHYMGNCSICAGRQKVFLMRAIKKHKKVYDKQTANNGIPDTDSDESEITD